MIKVLIGMEADLTLVGVQRVVASDPNMRVIATARMLDDLLDCITTQQPDVVILGKHLYGSESVVNTVRLIKAYGPRVIVMGGLINGLLIRDMLNAGLDSYLCTSDDLRLLLAKAIKTILCGRLYLSPTATAEYHQATRDMSDIDTVCDDEALAVLQRLACGYDAAMIACELGIGKRRVYRIRDKLRRSFGARTNEHLIACAAAEGFLALQ